MTAAPAISPGLPVEVGDIDRQLGLLWENSDAAKVRASLVNLVIYSEAADAIAANTPLLSAIAADHAFRALLVQGQPDAEKSGVHAWITAHCHLREAGKKEICSEQLTFQLDGPAAGRLPSIVFSHLDTDLPLYLWWQGDLHPDPDPGLWRWVDRLIVDSHSWSAPAAQFRILQEVRSLSRPRSALCDLNWTRLFHLRYAVAQIFDGPVFRRRDGGHVVCRLHEERDASACVPSVRLGLGDASASVRREENADYYLAEFTAPDHAPFAQMLPAGREKTSDILLSELSRISRHPLFWPSIRAVEPLLS